MSIISIAISEIYEQTGDLVNLELYAGLSSGFYARLRCDNMPLFDPRDGEQELSGHGDTPAIALMRLEVILFRYFGPDADKAEGEEEASVPTPTREPEPSEVSKFMAEVPAQALKSRDETFLRAAKRFVANDYSHIDMADLFPEMDSFIGSNNWHFTHDDERVPRPEFILLRVKGETKFHINTLSDEVKEL